MVDQKGTARSVAHAAIQKMTDKEIKDVKIWAEKALVIVEDNKLSKKEKILAIRKIGTTRSIQRILAALLKALKGAVWDNQSWARRFGVIGLGGGLIAFGTKFGGWAAAGTAHAVPIALVSGAGGALLGLLLDEVGKEILKRSKETKDGRTEV